MGVVVKQAGRVILGNPEGIALAGPGRNTQKDVVGIPLWRDMKAVIVEVGGLIELIVQLDLYSVTSL